MSASFRYEARGPSGRIERGALTAASREEALTRLRRRELTPLALDLAPRAQVAARLSDQTARDLSRTLAQLLRAGLSFAQALRFASEELAPAPAAVASRMREAAEQGEPASAALDAFDGAEARLFKGVVLAGETSGRLAEALEVAAQSFARAAELRARLATALIYPSFVILATLATLACFMLLVVPTLAEAFAGAEARLPDSTRNLLALSDWLETHGAMIALGLAAGAALLAGSTPLRRAAAGLVDRLLLTPAGLGIALRLDFAAFANLSALSLDAGAPSSASFDAAAAAVRNSLIRARLRRAIEAMRTGERASDCIDRFTAAPRTLLRMMHVGEETGRLADALRQAGALLSAEAERRLARLGAIAGPIVTLALGALVASVVVSLFLGLLALSDVAAF